MSAYDEVLSDPSDDELADILGFTPKPPTAPEGDGIYREVPPGRRIMVQANLPYLRNYARDPHPALSYGCDFPVALGDTVLLPPTPKDVRWTEGIVTGLGPSDYKGPVKNARPKEKP